MSITPTLPRNAPTPRSENAEENRSQLRSRRTSFVQAPFHLASRLAESDAPQRHAELFYLQKQIQSQTPMVIVLEDGEQITGCIEWYDRNTLKVRGKSRTLIFKSAIKYMYKLGDIGQ
jgi:sRNA-binding regulator protein Hfq